MKGKTSRGVGLRNIDERLKVLYADAYAFNLNIIPSGGLKTIIKLPFEIRDENISATQYQTQ
jgi:two-component system LytT family sensor kinase